MPESSARNVATHGERKSRVGLSALGSLISSNRRTNARMDRTQFEGAEKELRRVGGDEEVVACYKQAAEREAKVIEQVTNGRMKVSGDRIIPNQDKKRNSRSRSRSREAKKVTSTSAQSR
ncbi:unnamed protein product [Cladocopium goreaui]|uniref:Uncharacterized protein n=1 Tax=Cladocopium goreaui TaxID=2562237 RepID=A0A9P1DJ83_9DINO|nr:unnamed protein product [Cladocopium goreaui]|mmetsp:Transcript_63112/g.138223  ORF Transcript_63112/g.138223 Transcript_63112/m.138223 type:complete len:120 (-) Transcript_63112:66-425(-)